VEIRSIRVPIVLRSGHCFVARAQSVAMIFFILTIIINRKRIMLRPFFVRHNRVLKKIYPEDVICLSTEGNYTRIFLTNKSFYMVRSTLAAALKKLPADIFIKIHRSFIVSVYHIDSVHRDYLVVSNENLPIGKQYYRSLIEKLNVIE
jgi:DNA-binding LytR/AlgR family response regulator